MRIEINHKLLSDSPLNEANKSLYSFINKSKGDLIEDITYGNPTCYLISGYRGSGKSSFVMNIEAEIKSLSKTEGNQIVFVYTNFSKYKDQTYLLRKLIRGLYNEMKDLPSFIDLKKNEKINPDIEKKASLLEQLYDKTFYESNIQSLLSTKIENITVLNIDLVELLKLLGPFLALILFIINWSYLLIKADSLLNLFGIVSSGILAVAGAIKFTHTYSRNISTQEDVNRKSMYDNEIADYHLLNVLKSFQGKYKIIFVLDELDKLADNDIDTLLNEMKPYLVSGAASFIVVAGQSLFYKYSDSRTKDDALLSSMFSKFIHIPLFSRIELQELFKNVRQNSDPLGQAQEQLLNNYLDYLIFQSKKVPRKFISLMRQNLVWENGKSYLYVSEINSPFQVYTKINNVIDMIEDKEIASQDLDDAVKDYCVMQLYLKSHAILSVKKNQFSFDEITN